VVKFYAQNDVESQLASKLRHCHPMYMETMITLTLLAMLQLLQYEFLGKRNATNVALLKLQIAVLLIVHLRFC